MAIEPEKSIVELIDQMLKREKIPVPNVGSMAGKLILCERIKQELEILISSSRRKGYEQCAQALTQHRDGMDEIIAALGAAAAIVRSIQTLQSKAV